MLMHSIPFTRPGDEDAGVSRPGLVGRLKSWTVERRRQRIQRDAFATLLRVHPGILEDVTGLTRRQVEHAAKPVLNSGP